jgi:chromosome segregation ATPase
VKPCRTSNLLALESYAEVVTPEIREFVITRALEADAQRANLQDAAKSQLAQLGRRRELAEGELDKLKATADERLHNARTKDDEKELKRAESDYDAFEKEWATIDQLLEEITEAFKGLEQTRRTLVEETSKNIAKLGLSK